MRRCGLFCCKNVLIFHCIVGRGTQLDHFLNDDGGTSEQVQLQLPCRVGRPGMHCQGVGEQGWPWVVDQGAAGGAKLLGRLRVK